MASTEFQQQLQHLINYHSQENGSDTPDFLLAEYLAGCLALWNSTVKQREEWYGRSLTADQDWCIFVEQH